MNRLRIISHASIIATCAVVAIFLTLSSGVAARPPWLYGLLGAFAGLIAAAFSACLSFLGAFRETNQAAQFLVTLGLGLALQAIWLPEDLQPGIGVAGILAGFVGLCIQGMARAKVGA